MVTNTQCITQSAVDEIIDSKGYSNIHHLLHVTAYVVRFVKLLKAQIKGDDSIESGPIKASEINEAELMWIWVIQSKAFALEIHFICNSDAEKRVKAFACKSIWLVLWWKGSSYQMSRKNSSLPTNFKNPVLLPH